MTQPTTPPVAKPGTGRGHKTGALFPCVHCSTLVYRSPADQRKAKLGRFVCNKSCGTESTKAKNPKRFARNALNGGVKNGTIIKPDSCSICHAQGPVEGHHSDYSKPFDVIWLCRDCHDKESKEARLAEVERRRKYFGKPCDCGSGQRIVVRGVCMKCYMRSYEGINPRKNRRKHATDPA